MHYAAFHRDVFLTNIVQIFPTLVHNIHSFALYFLILVVATLLNECCPTGRGVPPPPGHYRIVQLFIAPLRLIYGYMDVMNEDELGPLDGAQCSPGGV